MGRIFKTDKQNDWMMSHTAMPQALICERYVRVFFGTRDHNNKPHVYIDINQKVRKNSDMSDNPVLGPGAWEI